MKPGNKSVQRFLIHTAYRAAGQQPSFGTFQPVPIIRHSKSMMTGFQSVQSTFCSPYPVRCRLPAEEVLNAELYVHQRNFNQIYFSNFPTRFRHSVSAMTSIKIPVGTDFLYVRKVLFTCQFYESGPVITNLSAMLPLLSHPVPALSPLSSETHKNIGRPFCHLL